MLQEYKLKLNVNTSILISEFSKGGLEELLNYENYKQIQRLL